MPAFDFIPGVAADAIVPLLHCLDDPQPVVQPAVVDQFGGDVVFDARPNLIRVGEGEFRASAVGPGAEQQPRFVVQDVGALAVLRGLGSR